MSGTEALANRRHPRLAGGVVRQAPGIGQGVLTQVEIVAAGHLDGEVQEVLGQAPPVESAGVEVFLKEGAEDGIGLGAAMEADGRGLIQVPVEEDECLGWRQVADLLEVLALADAVQHGLDMLTGAELVGGEVGAGAVIGAPLQGADMHPVLAGEMAAGADRLGAPLAKPGFTGDGLHPHLSVAAFGPLLDGTFQGAAKLAGAVTGVGEEGGDAVDAHGAITPVLVAAAGAEQVAIRVIVQAQTQDFLTVSVLHLGIEALLLEDQTRYPPVPEVTQTRADEGSVSQGLELLVVEPEGVLVIGGEAGVGHGQWGC